MRTLRSTARLCLLLATAQAGCASAGATQVFLETMATNAAKPWTGTGCDNAWTVAFSGGNPFEQAIDANYGPGNPFGLYDMAGNVWECALAAQ
jgi:formylglycine-generating enzyme required for sulfatase activity